jgi:hypothetical protein
MINLSEVNDIEFSGIDNSDYPNYSDAFIESAIYKGREMTQEEIDELMDDYPEFVYNQLMNLQPLLNGADL